MQDEEDEEWAEYREKVKDYSVLKIESVRLVDSIDAEVSINPLSLSFSLSALVCLFILYSFYVSFHF